MAPLNDKWTVAWTVKCEMPANIEGIKNHALSAAHVWVHYMNFGIPIWRTTFIYNQIT